MAISNKEVTDLPLLSVVANADVYAVKTDTDYRVKIGGPNGLMYLDGTGNIPSTFNVSWSQITSKPTTVSGYAISDVYTKAQIDASLALLAPKASPAFTGVPIVPTPATASNDTTVPSTAYVVARVAQDAPTKTGGGASGTWGINVSGNAATATKLATVRTINGVDFDGTGDITITAAASSVAWADVTGKPSTFTPSAHTHAWADITSGKPTTRNEYGITDVPLVDGSGSYGTWGISITGNAATASSAVSATKANTVAQGGTGAGMTFNWSGQPGQPTGLWGGSDGINHYVYNPANFSVNYANSAGAVAWGNVSGKPNVVVGTGTSQVFVQSGDPGGAAAEGALWAW